MTRMLLTIALSMPLAAPSAAQDDADQAATNAEGHVVGLLMVPDLMPPNPCAPVTVGFSVSLFDARNAATSVGELRVVRGPLGADAAASRCDEGPQVRVLVGGTSFPVATEEHSYEETSLVVTAIEQGWYQIRTGGAPGLLWMRHQPGSVYRSLAQLFDGTLTYLGENWDRRLYTSPGGTFAITPRLTPAEESPQLAVKVDEVVVVDGVYWARVTFVTSCDGEPSHRGSGWVRVHGPMPSPLPMLWFYSRGC